MSALGISKKGIDTALKIKASYKNNEPLVIPGEAEKLLVPETLLNQDLDLLGYEDPLALALMCTRDPESPMAMAAAARLCPIGNSTELVRGVLDIVAETSKHELVRECLDYVTDHAFEVPALQKVGAHAAKIVTENRRVFSAKLRQILQSLLDGELSPRVFVRDFFALTEGGNLRHDVRKKLVLSLLLSPAVRPSIKFLMLENFARMPKPVQLGIVSAVLKAEPSRHTEIIKEELHYIIFKERADKEEQDINGRPAAGFVAPAVAQPISPKPEMPPMGPVKPETEVPWFLA